MFPVPSRANFATTLADAAPAAAAPAAAAPADAAPADAAPADALSAGASALLGLGIPIYDPNAPQMAPPLPNLAKCKGGTAKLFARLRAFAQEDGVPWQERLKAIEDMANTPKETGNPMAIFGRLQTLRIWDEYATHRGIKPHQHWHPSVVSHLAVPYLHLRTFHTPGRAGATHVKASTVRSWQAHLVHCILTYTHDPVTGAKCGSELITTGGLFERLEQARIFLTHHLNLSRKRNPVQYFGRAEAKLQLEEALRVPLGRIVKLQSGAVIAISLHQEK
ncbi:hypothetical protein DENSPDRAFT_849071 [Dentipellis sp. KUC8613]|nr:hypothetical protein DENSPDRAFT_849071 [Dentipellis sp. KUC8613]